MAALTMCLVVAMYRYNQARRLKPRLNRLYARYLSVCVLQCIQRIRRAQTGKYGQNKSILAGVV